MKYHLHAISHRYTAEHAEAVGQQHRTITFVAGYSRKKDAAKACQHYPTRAIVTRGKRRVLDNSRAARIDPAMGHATIIPTGA